MTASKEIPKKFALAMAKYNMTVSAMGISLLQESSFCKLQCCLPFLDCLKHQEGDSNLLEI